MRILVQLTGDPYDITRVWLRDRAGAWITIYWTQLHRVTQPFGELAWNHVKDQIPGTGEAQIADAVEDLLRRAHQGPAEGPKPTAREKTVAARTRATAGPTWPRPQPLPLEPEPERATRASAAEAFEMFDPYQEAQRRW